MAPVRVPPKPVRRPPPVRVPQAIRAPHAVEAARPRSLDRFIEHTGNPDLTAAAPAAHFGSAQAGYSLPAQVELGANTIHRYTDSRVTPSVIAVTVFTPLPTAEFPGTVQDMNSRTFADRWPDRAVVGDAGLTRSFLGIDKRPGTPLDNHLEQILSRVPSSPDGRSPEAVIEFLRIETNRLIRWTPGSSANDGRAEFPWDKAIQIDRGVWDTFNSVAYQQVGEPPVSTGHRFPVVPFEKYLEAGEGYCIQKAVLASLVLDKAGIPHRLVNGAVAMGPGRTTGHSWIELSDGRVFDPAWGSLQKPTERDVDFPDRFRFGGSYRFENQRFPFLQG